MRWNAKCRKILFFLLCLPLFRKSNLKTYTAFEDMKFLIFFFYKFVVVRLFFPSHSLSDYAEIVRKKKLILFLYVPYSSIKNLPDWMCVIFTVEGILRSCAVSLSCSMS